MQGFKQDFQTSGLFKKHLFWFVGSCSSGFSFSSGSSEGKGVSSLLPESGAGAGAGCSSVDCGTGLSISGSSGRFCRTTALENWIKDSFKYLRGLKVVFQ